MRRSEARPARPAPCSATEHRCSVAEGATAGPEPAHVSADGERTRRGDLGCVGAYWRGSEIRARFRAPDGSLVEDRFPAEHSFFLRAEDVDRELSGAGTVGAVLRRSRAYRGERREGAWVRFVMRDRDALDAVCAPGNWATRAGVVTYEGDLHPVKRWLLNDDVKIGRPRRAYLDLEAYLPKGIMVHAVARTICWAISVDARDLSDDEREALSAPEDAVDVCVGRGMLEADSEVAERVLLESLLAALGEFDQVLAWGGDRFDFPFLEERAKQLGIDVEWRRWLLLDHMELARRMNVSASKSGAEKTSMALAHWAKVVLREQKVLDLGTGTHVAWKAWLAGGEERRRLGDYNVDDTGKMVRIERKTGFVELHQSICEVAGVLPSSRTVGPMQSVESFVMRLGRARGMRFPSFYGYQGGAETTDDGKLFEGAFVLKPTRLGIIENVHVCDFSRLYPSIAQTFNLSPETLFRRRSEIRPGEERPSGVCEVPGSGHWFRTEPRGLLPFVFDEMLRLRKVWDDKKAAAAPGTEDWNLADKRSTAYKNMTNAAFGVTGSRFSRFFVVECAESMTLGGAALIKRVIEEGEREGIEAIAGDTDSSFSVGITRAGFESFVERLNRDVFPAIVRDAGARDCRIKLAYEKAFERVVYVSAKHYAGRFAHYKGKIPDADSEPEVKGLEYKRGDTSFLARMMQAECLDLLLGGGVREVGSKRRPACESDPEAFKKLVDRWRSRVLNADLPIAEIVVTKRLSKEPEHYRRSLKKDGTHGAYPPQVRAALMARERGKDVGAGVRVEYVVADAREKQLVLAEDYDGANVDRAHLWENLVYPATMRVLQACFPAVKWEAWRNVRKHMGKPGQARLFEF